jgi:hypothetical protein
MTISSSCSIRDQIVNTKNLCPGQKLQKSEASKRIYLSMYLLNEWLLGDEGGVDASPDSKFGSVRCPLPIKFV